MFTEEVLGSTVAHWWSPEGKYICYSRFNDTEVPQYRFPYYGAGTNIYGNVESIAYPKVRMNGTKATVLILTFLYCC